MGAGDAGGGAGAGVGVGVGIEAGSVLLTINYIFGT
jgi:hypothetical protein